MIFFRPYLEILDFIAEYLNMAHFVATYRIFVFCFEIFIKYHWKTQISIFEIVVNFHFFSYFHTFLYYDFGATIVYGQFRVFCWKNDDDKGPSSSIFLLLLLLVGDKTQR